MSRGDPEETTRDIVGRRVVFVARATIFLDDRSAYEFMLDGDCCSSSEYTVEGEEAFKELIGSEIRDIEYRSGQSRDGLEREYPPLDSDTWHFLVFTTDKGHVTVDWRNKSNGYYDGWCWPERVRSLSPVAHDAACEWRLDIVQELYGDAGKRLDVAVRRLGPEPKQETWRGGLDFGAANSMLKGYCPADKLPTLVWTSTGGTWRK